MALPAHEMEQYPENRGYTGDNKHGESENNPHSPSLLRRVGRSDPEQVNKDTRNNSDRP